MPARPDPPRDLRGARIVLVGRFVSAARREFVQALRAGGATVDRQVTSETTFTIVGMRTWAIRRNGRVSRNLLVAQLLKMRQAQLQVLSESEFLRQFRDVLAGAGSLQFAVDAARCDSSGPDPDVGTAQSSPVPACFSDWRRAQLLAEWLSTGISPRRIERALHELGRWIPEARQVWEQFSPRWDGRRLVWKLPNGRWSEPSGQLLLDDAADEEVPAVVLALHSSPKDDPFGAAVRCEARGDFAGAERLYREILLLDGPDVDVCFNLANVLVERGRRRAALERLWQCVELAPRLVEAWYNLGLVAAELGDHPSALQALERAQQLAPDFTAAQQAWRRIKAAAGPAGENCH